MAGTKRMPNSDYKRLEERLILVAWLNSLFGYEHNRDMLKDLADVGEGVDSTGRSHVVRRLLSRGEKCRLPETELVRYDQHIRGHLAVMNRGRFEKISLRYFQFVAALYTEIYLDRLTNHPKRLLAQLNRFVMARNAKRLADETDVLLLANLLSFYEQVASDESANATPSLASG